MIGARRAWTGSLRLRLLAATLVAVAVAVLLAGLLLADLFRDHVLRQFGASLTIQLDQLTAQLEFDPLGQPRIDDGNLSDPRWSRPYSGLYWQLDQMSGPQPRRSLRSRSLWDAALAIENDALAAGVVHVHEIPGPSGARLLVVERTLRASGANAAARWRLVVAADLRETDAAVVRFNGVLAVSLAVLLALLGASAVAQVAIGLAPLQRLQRALTEVHEGRAERVGGSFPAEVQPLIDAFDAVLERNAEVVARARTQAGNLAHAIKTPLAAMAQAAQAASCHPQNLAGLALLVNEQVAVARRQVDWHLARSRAAAAHGMPGLRVQVAPLVSGLLRVMQRIHATKAPILDCAPIDPALHFNGEAQDLQEMLGNLLDNACKWCRSRVEIRAALLADGNRSRLRIVIEDDGAGIDADRRQSVLARGARLDESAPGSGLGLAIVNELVELYDGSIALARADLGGLRVELTLPGVATAAAQE